MHNMHWKHSRITTNVKFQSQFLYSFIKKHSKESVERRLCHLIWQLFACRHKEYCNKCVLFSKVSASSKNRFNSFRICVAPFSLYSKHGDTLPSKLSVALKTVFKCFDFATSFKNMQQFWKGNFVCWTCPKLIYLDRNFWCNRHVYYLKGLFWLSLQYSYEKQCWGDWIHKNFAHSVMLTWLYLQMLSYFVYVVFG